MSKRIKYFDFLRGIAIMMVIAIHSFDVHLLQTKSDGVINSALWWRNLLNPAVPIFLVISGYFLAKKEITWKNGYKQFLKKHIPRVYIPMLLWSLPLMIFSISKSGNTLHAIFWMMIGGYSIYYFIALIVQYYVLLPVLIKVGKTTLGLVLSILISAISMLVLFYLTVHLGYKLPLIVYAGPFFVWMMFFVLGIYLQFHKVSFPRGGGSATFIALRNISHFILY